MITILSLIAWENFPFLTILYISKQKQAHHHLHNLATRLKHESTSSKKETPIKWIGFFLIEFLEKSFDFLGEYLFALEMSTT